MSPPSNNSSEFDISVVVTVFRSAPVLNELYQRLITVLEMMDLSFEIIFIEDAGGDLSWQVIEHLAKNDNRVRSIKLSKNFGQHAATICGFAHSSGSWIITLDDDLEHNPEYIPALFERTVEGADLVYGIYHERSHSKWRNLTSLVARWMFHKAIPSLNYSYTSYRVIRGDIARKVIEFDSPYPFVDGYLSWLTNNYATVSITHDIRRYGVSNYTFKKLLTHTVNIFVTFSDLPLKFATVTGFISFLVGTVWLTIIFSLFLIGKVSISGYPSIMAGILAFGGIQLLVLGIFGEYLGRINFKTSRKPLYVIGEDTHCSRLK